MSDSDCLIVPSIRHRVRLRPVAAHGVPTGAGAGWLTPERYDSRMHHFEPSRPAAAASERERAVAETARRLRGLPPTPGTLIVYRKQLEDISAWLGGAPFSEHNLAL